MNFKNKNLEVPQENIFLHDKLNRKDSVENISLLLKNISSPIVFSVNAPWGAGKTSYLNMLNASLTNSGKKTIYFSAWETDFASDPLLAFLGEMNLALSPLLKADSAGAKAWTVTKKAASHILKRGLPVGVKLATGGLFDLDKVVETEAGKLAESLSKDLIDSYSKNKEAITQFKEGVRKVLSEVDSNVERLYVIVDELDRCRPTYAIELLERIKHLLDIEGLVFVLALDKVQLAHSVKAVYGSEFDALGYLKRFIDIEFTLPNVSLSSFVDHLYQHFGFDAYFNKRGNSVYTRYDATGLKDSIKVFTERTSMSLRSVEQLFSKVNLILLTVGPNKYLYPTFIVFLLVVKETHQREYESFLNPGSNGTELTDVLHSLIPGVKGDFKEVKADIEAMIMSAKIDTNKAWFDQSFKAVSEAGAAQSNEQSVRRYFTRVSELVVEYTQVGAGFPIDIIIKRVQMLNGFNFESGE